MHSDDNDHVFVITIYLKNIDTSTKHVLLDPLLHKAYHADMAGFNECVLLVLLVPK